MFCLKDWRRIFRAACTVLLLVTGIASGFLQAAEHSRCESPRILRFSTVPELGSRQQADIWKPFLPHLERHLGRPVELVSPSSYGSVIEGLIAGQIDVAILGPASYVRASRMDPRIEPFASFAKAGGVFDEGGTGYRSVLIVPAKSRASSMDDLKGKRLALVDPNSTSGSQVPRKHFQKQYGLNFERHFSSVGYMGDHQKSIQAVLEGKVDAAFVADEHLSSLAHQGQLRADSVRVIWRSEVIRREPLVMRGGLCADVRKRVEAAFLDNDFAEYADWARRMRVIRFMPVTAADYALIAELIPN